jgi:hypothetical protein
MKISARHKKPIDDQIADLHHTLGPVITHETIKSAKGDEDQ